MNEFFALLLYFSVVFAIAGWSARKVRTSADFVLGNRSLGYLLTAMAAHASDMSSWLFMAYPAIVFSTGLVNAWVGIGLLIFMWLNWTFVAKKIRLFTEKWGCTTLSAFFHKGVDDSSGVLALVSAIFSFIFYTVYVSAGLMGLGILCENLLGIDYVWGISLGIAIVFAYLMLGGYIALAWLDLFQGIFLLVAILFVPVYLGLQLGGLSTFLQIIEQKPTLFQLIPELSPQGVWAIISLSLGWGLGYFGQPHILTKFMGIKDVSQIGKSRLVGMSWMILALGGATAVGLVGIAYFPEGLANPQTIFVEMARGSFHPFIAALILCAIIAATINVISSQLLVMSSTLTEDLLGKVYPHTLSSKNKLLLSRLGVLGVALVAYGVASLKISSVFSLVQYAWSGLGGSFGPLILTLLYSKNVTRQGALAGLIIGGATTALWPLLQPHFPVTIDALIPAYFLSITSILFISRVTAGERFRSPPDPLLPRADGPWTP